MEDIAMKLILASKSPRRKEILEITLGSYISMIDNCGTIKNTKMYNILDPLSKGKFSLNRPSAKYTGNFEKIITNTDYYMDIDYLEFLLDIAQYYNLINNYKKSF